MHPHVKISLEKSYHTTHNLGVALDNQLFFFSHITNLTQVSSVQHQEDLAISIF